MADSPRRRSRSRSGSPARRPKVSKGFKWKEKRPTEADDRRGDDRGPRHSSYRDRSPRRDDRDRDREYGRDRTRDGDRNRYRDRSPRRDRDRDGDRYYSNNSNRRGDRDRDRDARERSPRNGRDREGRSPPPSKGDNYKPKSSDKPKPAAAAAQPRKAQQQEEMIVVTVNDRLGTKAQIPAFPSDTVGQFKIMVAAKIGREPHEILLKRQGERPFKDHITLGDYGVSNGVQLDLEVDTGD
ncbi:ubiquitin-related domain-containing protein [Achaetomium macrosporum]|uniref:Ubiquitin-like modifier HUB1 n=1 Tax=Achaetomium macrosporum TaxID=79813 RepID=A0AAN7HCX1_9PEZI|nr:ubiquitin-related domain-containing protein [Achaetomium macrosporum]